PGGNITGINILTSELATKRVGLLHDLVPSASVFAHLVNPNFPSTENIIEEVDKAAQLLGLKTVVLKAVSKAEIDTAFAAIQEKRIGALLGGSDSFFSASGINSLRWLRRPPFQRFLSNVNSLPVAA